MLHIARELLAVCMGRRRMVRVHGESMTPTLEEGQVLAIARGPGELPRPGQLVAVRDPRDGRLLIKRCVSRSDCTFAVSSDNPVGARDSRTFGSLTTRDLVGTTVWRWCPRQGFCDLQRPIA